MKVVFVYYKTSVRVFESGDIYIFIYIYFIHIITFYLFIVFKEWFYSLDIYSFCLVSTCNPDCSIRMNGSDCPWIPFLRTFCFADYTFFYHQYLITNFVIKINSFFYFHRPYSDQFGVAYSLLFSSSQLCKGY